LGLVALLAGDLEEAAQQFTSSLETAATLGLQRMITGSLIGLAAVSAHQDRLLIAARLVGAVDGILEQSGGSLETFERQIRDDVERMLAAAADAPLLAEARAETRGWTEARTVNYALENSGSRRDPAVKTHL
jgi:hypothetical protein